MTEFLPKVRKLADLYFLMKMYKQSYSYYHTAKKDFQVNSSVQSPTEINIKWNPAK